jgi:hypothetical protein
MVCRRCAVAVARLYPQKGGEGAAAVKACVDDALETGAAGRQAHSIAWAPKDDLQGGLLDCTAAASPFPGAIGAFA